MASAALGPASWSGPGWGVDRRGGSKSNLPESSVNGWQVCLLGLYHAVRGEPPPDDAPPSGHGPTRAPDS